MLQACEVVLANQDLQKLKRIPLSASTVKRRIKEMVKDIENKVTKRVKNFPLYSIQFDKFTDVSDKVLLLCFVRIENEGKLYEELLCSLKLPGTTTSFDIFKTLDSYFQKHGIEWKKCISICTDGAANMTGHHSGVVAEIKNVIHPDLLSIHCIIHREHLVAKKMSPELHEVLSDVIKIINEIQQKALISQIFEAFCEKMGSQYSHLILYAEMRCLFTGKILNRVFVLLEEIRLFF